MSTFFSLVGGKCNWIHGFIPDILVSRFSNGFYFIYQIGPLLCLFPRQMAFTCTKSFTLPVLQQPFAFIIYCKFPWFIWDSTWFSLVVISSRIGLLFYCCYWFLLVIVYWWEWLSLFLISQIHVYWHHMYRCEFNHVMQWTFISGQHALSSIYCVFEMRMGRVQVRYSSSNYFCTRGGVCAFSLLFSHQCAFFINFYVKFW
jgi:hypothetical protein